MNPGMSLAADGRPELPRASIRRRGVTTAGVLVAGLLLALVPGVRFAYAATNLINNASMENLLGNGFPSCWQIAGWGDNTYQIGVTTQAHSGTKAMMTQVTARTSGDRKVMMLENAECAPKVTVGKQYDLGVWAINNTPNAVITTFRRDITAGWQYWGDLAQVPVSTTYKQTSVRTPVVPPNTDMISWGVTVYGVGTVITDDYTMVDPLETTPTTPAATTAAPTTPAATTPAATTPAATPTGGGTCTDAVKCVKGSWTVAAEHSATRARAVHSVVLNNGKVLMIAGSGNDTAQFAAGTFKTSVYDPTAGTFTEVPTPADLFCSGHVQLANGKVLVMGGNAGYPTPTAGYKGLPNSYLFDPATNRYTRVNDMADGHWYPSATVLGNGDVLSLGGLGPSSSGTVATEYFKASENRWLSLGEAKQTWSYWGLYPTMVLMQDGRLFYTGSHTFGQNLPGTGASIYNYGTGSIVDVPGLQAKDYRDQSMSVLLPPAQAQRVITIGGGQTEENPEANRLVDLIDLKAANPTYTPGPLLPQGTLTGGVPQTGNQGKMYVSAVILPDGKVFETGGGLHNRADPVYEASMFDPVTNKWTAGMATDPKPRTYHSSSVLLPDGRVMSFGDNPGNGSFETAVSIYSPPYLYKGARPLIKTVASTNWAYGTKQNITVNSAVTKAQLIRPMAVTHSSDPNQRSVDLPMTVTGNTIGLNLTANPNIAPPGWYMLTVTNAAGVPSVAKWVKVG